jgi:SAM-dependent methyltransferase
MDAFRLLLYVFLGIVVLSQTAGRLVRRLWRFPIPSFMTQLIDNPFRWRFIQPPTEFADRLRLGPSMSALEIGPGKGSYTFEVARRVAPGTVYACDISPYVVERLTERVKREGVTNVEARVEDVYHLSFQDSSMDRVYMIATLPEIPGPVEALRECRRVLKPGGLLCLSELFFDPDYPLRSTEKRWAKEAGLVLEEEHGGLVCYQLVFVKPI